MDVVVKFKVVGTEFTCKHTKCTYPGVHKLLFECSQAAEQGTLTELLFPGKAGGEMARLRESVNMW